MSALIKQKLISLLNNIKLFLYKICVFLKSEQLFYNSLREKFSYSRSLIQVIHHIFSNPSPVPYQYYDKIIHGRDTIWAIPTHTDIYSLFLKCV